MKNTKQLRISARQARLCRSRERFALSWLLPFLVIAFLVGVPLRSERSPVQWKPYLDVPPDLPSEGYFLGDVRGTVILAGGVKVRTEPESAAHNDQKELEDRVWAIDFANSEWRMLGRLEQPVAFGNSVGTVHGLVCIGGQTPDGSSSAPFILRPDPSLTQFDLIPLPPLPKNVQGVSLAFLNGQLYAAGLKSNRNGKPFFARFAMGEYLTATSRGNLQRAERLSWHILPPWPGPGRLDAVLTSQSDGEDHCIFLFGGRGENSDQTPLEQWGGYKFNPSVKSERLAWQEIQKPPVHFAKSIATPVGQTHILIPGGIHENGRQFSDSGAEAASQLLSFHTISQSWLALEHLPEDFLPHAAIETSSKLVVVGMDRNRPDFSPPFYIGIRPSTARHFTGVDWAILTVYFSLLIFLGYFFSRRTHTTGDYFLAGQRIPWWAAGLSLMATSVSSIGFIAVPSKSFATNWAYFAGVITWFIVVPVVTRFYIPMFRRLRVTSVYEYLEARFNVAVRLFASLLFCFLQTGRLAVVLYLPALVLSAVVGIDIYLCIIVMGVIAVLYTALGGIEAVIWTDVIQAFVLMGGAILCILLAIYSAETGVLNFLSLASEDGKFKIFEWGWDHTAAVLWVIVLGNVLQRHGALTADQSIAQRFLTTRDEKQTIRALWADVAVSIPWAAIAFFLGTSLYVFYQVRPELLPLGIETDAVVPLFIAQQVPSGLTGLIIAAIFAAAMSSLDSSMHSLATVSIRDFYVKLRPAVTDRQRFVLARWLTVLFGLFGTVTALIIATYDVKSAWDLFLGIVGLFIGSLTGLFAVGLFTTRCSGASALSGAVLSAIAVYFVSSQTNTHFFLYPAVGFLVCVSASLFISLFLARETKDVTGLTVYTLDSTTPLEVGVSDFAKVAKD